MNHYRPSADAIVRRLEAGGCPVDDAGYDRKTNTYSVMVKIENLGKLQFQSCIKDFVSLNFEGGRVIAQITWR